MNKKETMSSFHIDPMRDASVQNSRSSLDFFGLPNVSYTESRPSLSLSARPSFELINLKDVAVSPAERIKLMKWKNKGDSDGEISPPKRHFFLHISPLIYEPFILAASILYTIFTPVVLTYTDSIDVPLYIFLYVLDILSLYAHIVRRYDKIHRVDHSTMSAKKIITMKRDLILNICSTFPIDAAFIPLGYPYVPAIRLTRMFQLFCLMKFLFSLERRVEISFLLGRVVKLIVLIIVYDHLLGCIFILSTRFSSEFFLSSLWDKFVEFENLNMYEIYLRGFYWAAQTITSVGYGDIVPMNDFEYAIVWLLLNLSSVLWVYVLANATSLIMRNDNVLENDRNSQTNIEKYLKRREISDAVTNKVRAYFRDKIENNDTVDEEVLETLPFSLKKDVTRLVNQNILLQSRYEGMLAGCSQSFLSSLASVCRRSSFHPGASIIHQGDYSHDMYILEKGFLEVKEIKQKARPNVHFSKFERMFEEQKDDMDDLSDQEEEEDIPHVIGSISSPGASFGCISFIFGVKEPYEIICLNRSICLVISKDAFEKVLKRFPHQIDFIKNNIAQDVKVSNKKLYEEIKISVKNVRMEAINKLFYAISINDGHEIVSLLKHTDIKGRDYEHRTCLHVAATKGNIDVIELLIEGGASINAVDQNNHTPLMAAVLHCHSNAIDVLLEKGGEIGLSDVDLADLIAKYMHSSNLLHLRLLLRASPGRASVCNYDKKNAAHLACTDGLFEPLLVLLNHGIDISACDRFNKTPLQYAVTSGNERVVHHLLSIKAEFKMEDYLLYYNLSKAIYTGKLDQLQLLLLVSKNPNAIGFDGRTPLHVAVSTENIFAIQILLSYNASITLKTSKYPKSPLDEAIGKEKLVYLLKGGEMNKLFLKYLNKSFKRLTFNLWKLKSEQLSYPPLKLKRTYSAF